MIPLDCNKINARPQFVGSFGIAIVAPSESSSTDFTFLEYNASGSTWMFPTDTNFVPLLSL